jgi:magnesium-protoporphyrin IX monomethyl ester (oxidative) cyclase
MSATIAIQSTQDSTAKAQQSTVLSPQFYTTDYEAMDRFDVSPMRREWEALMDEFRRDDNQNHFRRSNEDFSADVNRLPPALREEFLEFLVSSVTSEFSGCLLYADIKKRVKNPDMREVMGYMSRDEARHAGFINQSLKDFNVAVDLGLLRRAKKIKYFKPKFIFYAVYLSEKIGYARYITIFRQLERHPEHRFHPIFKWFERWCNDEFRHGEVFAIMMRADPKLLTGLNKYWIRFFLLAVYATMYVRDHTRPELHSALGLDPTAYDYQVFRITNEISKQVFPVLLDIDNPAFRERMDRLRRLQVAAEAAKAKGGVLSWVKRAGCGVAAAATLVQLYFTPVITNELPANVRTAPAW